MQDKENETAILATNLVVNCVRNTYLEDLHAGKVPSSKTGDYTDVKVVTPYGEIPWNELSRLSNDEMKTLMIEVVDKVFTYLTFMGENRKGFLEAMYLMHPSTRNWDKPKIDKSFAKVSKMKDI
jgi:hypothetical protein